MAKNQQTLNLINLSKKHSLLLNEISKEITVDFHLLIEDVYGKTDLSVDWIVNSVVSRNNYFSTLFIDLCFLELTKKLCETESFTQIISPSRRLKRVVLTHLQKEGIKKKIIVNEKFISRFKNLFVPVKNLLHNILLTISLILNTNKGRKEKFIQSQTALILVDTWITKSEFHNNEYIPRHYSKKDFWDKIEPKTKIKTYFLPEFSFGPKDILSRWINRTIK